MTHGSLLSALVPSIGVCVGCVDCQALGQAAIAPAGSAPYRRRSVATLFDPDARVMVWTEFFLFTLFAAFEYTFETADRSVAAPFFDVLVAEYSCGQFVTRVGGNAGSLVVKDPGQGGVAPGGGNSSSSCKYGHSGTACMYKDLIDWPVFNDSLLPADSPDRLCCRDGYVMNAANAPINAHVWAAYVRGAVRCWGPKARYLSPLVFGLLVALFCASSLRPFLLCARACVHVLAKIAGINQEGAVGRGWVPPCYLLVRG